VASWENRVFLSEGLANSRRQQALQASREGRGLAAGPRPTFPDRTAPGETGLVPHYRRARHLDRSAGGGSKLVRRLPAAPNAAAAAAVVPAAAAPRLRVLIADDHSLFADALSAILRLEEGVEVIGYARNGQEAVELAATLAPDLILIDLDMPVMDGIEAIRRIRETSQVTMLLLTASDSSRQIALALAAGASGFLRKDVVPSDFTARVNELGGRPSASPLQ
jgi:CheY-like chemotaxis protein